MRELHADLLRARRELPPGDAGDITFDEHAGWLRVDRGPFAVVANFSRRDSHVPIDHVGELVVATSPVTLEPGYVVLPPLSGALVRLTWAP
jgi:maltooligosyltrehalose trehalohydrolase